MRIDNQPRHVRRDAAAASTRARAERRGRSGVLRDRLDDLGQAHSAIVDDVVHGAGGRAIQREHRRAHRIVEMDQRQLPGVAADDRQPAPADLVDHVDRRRHVGAVEQAVAQDDAFDRARVRGIEHLRFHRSDGATAAASVARRGLPLDRRQHRERSDEERGAHRLQSPRRGGCGCRRCAGGWSRSRSLGRLTPAFGSAVS